MKPQIRKANLNDLSVLKEFKLGLIAAERPMDPEILASTTNYYSLPDLIKNEDSEIYVVENNSQIVASGYVKIKDNHSYMKSKKIGYLGFMFVPKLHRGNGYNKMVLNALMAWSKHKGVYEIRLDVYDVNDAAISAYKKAGFENYLVNMRMNIENLDLDEI